MCVLCDKIKEKVKGQLGWRNLGHHQTTLTNLAHAALASLNQSASQFLTVDEKNTLTEDQVGEAFAAVVREIVDARKEIKADPALLQQYLNQSREEEAQFKMQQVQKAMQQMFPDAPVALVKLPTGAVAKAVNDLASEQHAGENPSSN